MYLLPPDFSENETGAISPLRLPLIISLEICRIFSSLAMEIPEALSHLNLCVSDNRVIKKKMLWNVYMITFGGVIACAKELLGQP